MTGPAAPAAAPHVSVLLAEVIDALEPGPGKLVVDATFGAGGYSRAFLDLGCEVIAFDRDPAAPLEATGRFRLVEDRFSAMADHVAGGCDGIAFDLGVSSMQLDQAERGFSFMRAGPLDMRMAQSGTSAADLVNGAEQAELARIFYVYGEERQSRRIASAIVRRRADQPFADTLDLAEVVERALGGRRGAKTHPATRASP
jgi:16S rRNA (cytosine1402-N4)-methyltransferase